MQLEVSVTGLSVSGGREGKGRGLQHHPRTPTFIFPCPDCSPSMENQYKPLIGPGTDKRTRTRRSRERAVNPKEMAGLARME